MTLKREHPAYEISYLLWVIFALLDPDPDFEYESTDLKESGPNPDPDPDPEHRLKVQYR
jgi:hypothetical protein